MARGKQGEIAKYLQTEFLDYLEIEARKTLDNIISGVDYTNRTFNLYDSYAYGIYLNGTLRRTSATLRDRDSGESVSVGTRAPKATKPRIWYGEETWGKVMRDMMFDTEGGYRPSTTKGYVVVFAASMPYAPILDAGGGSLRRKYNVIAHAESEISNFGSDLMSGMVRKVNIKLHPIWEVYE
jgi:hypothetical protein